MLAQDTVLTNEQSYSLLSKTECLFAAIWHNPEGVEEDGAVDTEAIAQYYEVPTQTVLDTLLLHQDEFDLQSDGWKPRAVIRLGMLLKSPQATRVRSLALDVIEAQKCKTKRDSITYLLRNSEFVQWSDREISKILQCSPTIVGQARKELESQGKIVQFKRRKFSRGGNTIEQTATKESAFQASSVHNWTDEAQNPDSVVNFPVARVTASGHPREGQQGVIVDEKDDHWQKLIRFEDGAEEAIAITDLDAPSTSYTPTPRTYTEDELQQAIARAVEEAQIGKLSELREKAESAVREELRASQAIASQKSLEIAKLQQKIDELESLRTLEVENQILRQRIQDLENAMEERACQQWGNTFTKQAEKVINVEVVKAVESLEPELNLRTLATTPPPRHKYAEVLQLLEKSADLLDRVPLVGRRVLYQGRYGTIEDIENEQAEINWDIRQEGDSAGDRYPLPSIEVLPTIEGIAKGSFVSWANPKEVAYNYHGEVIAVYPRLGEVDVYWQETNKSKRHPIKALRLIRGVRAA